MEQEYKEHWLQNEELEGQGDPSNQAPHQMALFELGASMIVFLPVPRISALDTDSKLQEHALALPNAAIEVMNTMKDVSGTMPAMPIFCAVIIFLKLIRVCFLFFDGLLWLHVQPGFYGQ